MTPAVKIGPFQYVTRAIGDLCLKQDIHIERYKKYNTLALFISSNTA